MALPVDLGGLRIEAARLVNEDVDPASRLEQPLRGTGVAAVDEPSAIPLHHASHGAAAMGLVIDEKRRQPRSTPQLRRFSIGSFDPPELVTEEPRHRGGDCAEQLLDVGKNAPVSVHTGLVARWVALVAQRPDDARSEEHTSELQS